ncbi:hypothetical protein ACJJTC_017108 [Scirpophaga incertulas]
MRMSGTSGYALMQIRCSQTQTWRTVSTHLTAISMSSESWEELATKRTEWRTAVKTGLENFESTRLEELDSKRQHRKTRPKPSYDYTYDSNGNLYCASCNRTFKSKFGFASHARAHARRDQGIS